MAPKHESDDEFLVDQPNGRKRRKTNSRPSPVDAGSPVQLGPLLDGLATLEVHEGCTFEQMMESILPELLQVQHTVQEAFAQRDVSEQLVKPLSRSEARHISEKITSDNDPDKPPSLSIASALIARKLASRPSPLRHHLLNLPPAHLPTRDSVTPLPAPRTTSSVNSQVLDALYAIQTTPYERSFLSRLQGFQPPRTPGAIAVDWETRSPWMDLMTDIREHFSLAHSDREQPVETIAPIEYVTLRLCHLDQVHDLLARTFWDGINVSDSLQYSPEKCTIIATYKQLVVGAAFLSSPRETYITYLAVRAGWENAQIATSMLYHLITLNPNRDITLHVSINNPAMLLYNRFGFKAEQFIVGFYEDYLDPQSRASKNAFRLRLRR